MRLCTAERKPGRTGTGRTDCEVVDDVAKGKYQKWLTKDGRLLLEAWARDGLTDEQLAHNMGISRSTFAVWKNRFPDISDALKKGKEVVDVEVENALLKRAKGFAYLEEKQEIDAAGRRTVTKTVKQVAPDVGAAAFWLKNRKPSFWRDHPVNGDDNTGQLEQLLKGLKSDGN